MKDIFSPLIWALKVLTLDKPADIKKYVLPFSVIYNYNKYCKKNNDKNSDKINDKNIDINQSKDENEHDNNEIYHELVKKDGIVFVEPKLLANVTRFEPPHSHELKIVRKENSFMCCIQ